MRYISLIFVAFLFFAISCGSNNTVKPKWDGCITNENCENGEKCIAGNCTESNTCEKNEDCLNGQFCNDDKLCETYCETNDDCGAGFICNSESKKCEKDPNVTTCEKDADCKEGQICKDYECIDDGNTKTCESDANCLNGYHCSNKTCTENCTETSCENGFQCNNETKECEKMTCEKDADCKEGFYCENQECKTKNYECTQNSDCFNGYECKDNKCQLINDDSCNTVDDCDGPLTIRCMDAHWECIENTCEQKCGAASCETADDCPGTPYIDCEGAHWECKENTCTAACGGNDKCGNGTCDVEIGENYENCPADCRDDHCDDGTEPLCDMMPPNCADGQILAYYNDCYACVNPVTCKPIPERCRTNEECGEGFICTEDGVCKAIEPECRIDEDCDDGNLCTIDACGENGICNTMAIRCPTDMTCNPETGQCEGERPRCGDGVCQEGEQYTCPEDCQQLDCRVDADCNDGNPCTTDKCANGICSFENVVCPDGSQCNPETGSCGGVPSCGNNICEVGEEDTCPEDCGQTDCRVDADCGESQICDNETCKSSICIPGFLECPEGFSCAGNTCIRDASVCGNNICEDGEQDTCPQDCQQIDCNSDADCPDNQACVNNQCQGIGPVCPDDQFEDNDDIGHPARVQNGNYNNLTITYEDEDWYSFDYDGQTNLEITFNFTNSNGDIDIYAFQDGRQISSSEGYTDSETLIIDPIHFHAGEVLINAALIQNQNEPYHECQTYSVKTTTDANTCIPDQFEVNNTRRNASDIEFGNYDLTLCDADTDWFTFRMDTFTSLEVNTTMGYKTSLYVRGQSQALANSQTSSDGTEHLNYLNNNQDSRSIDVFLKVYKDDITIDDNASYDYNLNLQLFYIN